MKIKPWIPLLLFAAALIIRLWYGSTMIIAGDDMSSLVEARNIGQNLQGLPYFLLLSVWERISLNPLWLHSLSALISALAVVACWYWLKPRGTYIALVASILLMISSVVIADSVTIRYYGLYLLASILFFSAYWNILFKARETRSRTDWVLLILSAFLLIFSQLLGIVVVSLVIVHAAICFKSAISRWLVGLVALEVVAGLILVAIYVLSPQFRVNSYLVFSRIIASSAQTYEGPRGWSLIMFAKLGIMFFSLAIGPDTYPLTWIVVIPALVLTFVFGLLGVVRLVREKLNTYLLFVVIVGFLGIAAVYLGLDGLLPPSFHDTAAPRTIYFALPILFWIIAEGTETIRSMRVRWLVVGAFVILQGFGLVTLFQKDYPPGLSNADWTSIVAQIDAASAQKSSSVWVDGEADGTAQFYLGKAAPIQSAYDLINQDLTPKADAVAAAQRDKRVILLGFDARVANRCTFEGLLSSLSKSHEVLSIVDYPIFVYAFDPGTASVNTGLGLPRSVFPPELQDLKLPQSFSWQNQQLAVGGVSTLPNCKNDTALDVSVSGGTAHSILLLSDLTQADNIPDGTPVGQLTVNNQTVPLRKGYETQSWNSACVDSCKSAVTWHKRIALVGTSSFPDAYKDFEAHIWAVQIPISQPSIQSLQIKLLSDTAHMNIYGVYLLP